MSEKSSENKIGLLRFVPHYRSVRWGGRRIAAFKNIELADDRVGESWEISALPQMESVVTGGVLDGLKLSEVLDRYGLEIMGETLLDRYKGRFPLLIKFIDAEDDLSIQVHPNDVHSDGNGKTELWYIIDSLPGSHIYSGFNQNLNPQTMRTLIDRRRVTEVLATHFSQMGDVYYLPAGRIHSIGAGNLVLEIQQSSDITYRLWDWDRRDSHGQLRELHVDKALEAVDFSQTDYGLARPQVLPDRETIVKRTPYFTVTAVKVVSRMTLPVESLKSFRILVAVEGDGVVTDDAGCACNITRGQSVLVPAAVDSVTIQAGSQPLKLITAYIE